MKHSTDPNHRPGRLLMPGLTAALVVAIAAGCSTKQASEGAPDAGEPRVVRQMDIPLLPSAAGADVRRFSDGAIRGDLDATGNWQVRGEIEHPRLRCATYRMSLRFGIGEGGCNAVEWLTPAVSLPSRKQCNNATLIHSGNGLVELSQERLDALSCVRVTLQCSGGCG
jgi:hypothetical protein